MFVFYGKTTVVNIYIKFYKVLLHTFLISHCQPTIAYDNVQGVLPPKLKSIYQKLHLFLHV